MTQTTTDYLFQATTAVPDRSYSASVTNGGLDKFDDHLSQASSLAGGDSQSFGAGTQRADTSFRDDGQSKWNSDKSNTYSNGSASSQPTSEADQQHSHDAAEATSNPSEPSRSNEHDEDKSNDTTAVEAAGASQAAKQSAKPVDSKSEHSEKSEVLEAVKAATANKKTAELNGDNKSNEAGEAKAPANAPVADGQHAEETAKLAAKVADESKSKEKTGAASAAEKKNREEKASNKGAAKVKAKPGANSSSSDASDGDGAVQATDDGETATEAVTKEQAKAEAAAAVAAGKPAKGASDTDDSSAGDSSKDSQPDARGAARSDPAIAAAKVDAAQLAAGAANSPDANPNASPKGKVSGTTTKPIEAKGEAPAVAFARMSKPNNSGASSASDGANESRQVDPSRFIGRVAKAFQTAQDRGGTLQLRLSPPELGALRIELNVKDGAMSASLQTENANARKLLLDHLPALRDRLAEQNIRVDRFDVDVRQDGSGAQADARGWQQQQPQHQPDQSAPRRRVQTQPKVSAVAAPVRVASAPAVSDTALNLII